MEVKLSKAAPMRDGNTEPGLFRQDAAISFLENTRGVKSGWRQECTEVG